MKWEMEAKRVENGIKVYKDSLFWVFGHERKASGKAHTFTGQAGGHGKVDLSFPGGSVVKNSPANAGDMGSIPGSEDPLEKEMATHSNILAWKNPMDREPWGVATVHGNTKSWA